VLYLYLVYSNLLYDIRGHPLQQSIRVLKQPRSHSPTNDGTVTASHCHSDASDRGSVFERGFRPASPGVGSATACGAESFNSSFGVRPYVRVFLCVCE